MNTLLENLKRNSRRLPISHLLVQWRDLLDARLQRVLDAVVQLLRLEAEVRAVEEREHAQPEAPQGRPGVRE